MAPEAYQRSRHRVVEHLPRPADPIHALIPFTCIGPTDRGAWGGASLRLNVAGALLVTDDPTGLQGYHPAPHRVYQVTVVRGHQQRCA